MEGTSRSMKENAISKRREQIMDWRKLFDPDSDQALQYFPPQIIDGKPIVAPPADIFEEGIEIWKNAMVA
ncbi:hypothetical protein DITRI_Ditri06bG0017100 [Diplodiscus trichospermus]